LAAAGRVLAADARTLTRVELPVFAAETVFFLAVPAFPAVGFFPVDVVRLVVLRRVVARVFVFV